MKKIFTLAISLIFGLGFLLVIWSSVAAIPEPGPNTGTTVDEGSVGNIIDSAMLSVTDSVEVTYILDAAPSYGVLRANGSQLTDTDTFTQSDINNSLLTYDHDGRETPLTDVFTFSIQGSISPTLLNQPFNITVIPVNDPPVANPDTIYVLEGGTTNITGDGGDLATNDIDPDSGTLTVTTIPVTPPSYTDTFSLGPSGSFTYQHDGSENLSDTFIYEICDQEPLCDSATVTVVVTGVVDIPPVLNEPLSRFSINENSSDGLLVGDLITSTDVEVSIGNYDSLSYSIIGGNIGEAFTINTVNNQGRIVVQDGTQLNFENPNTKTFTLTVQVADDSNATDFGSVYIDLIDLNEHPSVDSNQEFSISEDSSNNDPVGTVQASDPDEGDDLTFSIISGSNPGGAFKIDPDSGEISVADATQLDYDEGLRTYSLNIQVRDNGTGNLAGSGIVTVNITGVNESPTVQNDSFEIDENSSNNTPVGAVTASDPEVDNNQSDSLTFSIIDGNINNAFAFSGNNIIVNDSSVLNFEGPNDPFALTVQVKDSGNLTDTATINISLADVNEAPVIAASQTFTVSENSANNFVVDTVVATDVDAADNGNLTFEITNSDPSTAFSIDNDGVIRVSDGSQLNHEQIEMFTLDIKVTDSNWDGPAKSDTESLVINVGDVNEQPSVAGGQSFSVVGYSSKGTQVGTVLASDPDDGDSLTYQIVSGNTNNAFAIDDNGDITVNNRNALDFDQIQVFNLVVRVLDSKNLPSANRTVVINVTEPPIFLIYVPVLLNNYRADEPNDNCAESYAIKTGATYSFLPEDGEDWYKFTLTSNGNISVVLSNYQVDGQIVAYRGSCGSLQFIQNNGNFSSTKILNLGNLPAGTYFIRVVTDPPYNNTLSYNLIINQ